jgi:hypothetical protein
MDKEMTKAQRLEWFLCDQKDGLFAAANKNMQGGPCRVRTHRTAKGIPVPCTRTHCQLTGMGCAMAGLGFKLVDCEEHPFEFNSHQPKSD